MADNTQEGAQTDCIRVLHFVSTLSRGSGVMSVIMNYYRHIAVSYTHLKRLNRIQVLIMGAICYLTWCSNLRMAAEWEEESPHCH